MRWFTEALDQRVRGAQLAKAHEILHPCEAASVTGELHTASTVSTTEIFIRFDTIAVSSRRL